MYEENILIHSFIQIHAITLNAPGFFSDNICTRSCLRCAISGNTKKVKIELDMDTLPDYTWRVGGCKFYIHNRDVGLHNWTSPCFMYVHGSSLRHLLRLLLRKYSVWKLKKKEFLFAKTFIRKIFRLKFEKNTFYLQRLLLGKYSVWNLKKNTFYLLRLLLGKYCVWKLKKRLLFSKKYVI